VTSEASVKIRLSGHFDDSCGGIEPAPFPGAVDFAKSHGVPKGKLTPIKVSGAELKYAARSSEAGQSIRSTTKGGGYMQGTPKGETPCERLHQLALLLARSP
jgi:hypothetical protein